MKIKTKILSRRGRKRKGNRVPIIVYPCHNGPNQKFIQVKKNYTLNIYNGNLRNSR